MGNSSFAALVLIVLLIAVAMLFLAPHERQSTASLRNPASLWSSQR
jgi:hypothetical protein